MTEARSKRRARLPVVLILLQIVLKILYLKGYEGRSKEILLKIISFSVDNNFHSLTFSSILGSLVSVLH